MLVKHFMFMHKQVVLPGLGQAVAYYNQSDGTDTNGYITQTSVATSNTDFDDKAVT